MCGKGVGLCGVLDVPVPIWLGFCQVLDHPGDTADNDRVMRPVFPVGLGKMFYQHRWAGKYEVYALWECF